MGPSLGVVRGQRLFGKVKCVAAVRSGRFRRGGVLCLIGACARRVRPLSARSMSVVRGQPRRGLAAVGVAREFDGGARSMIAWQNGRGEACHVRGRAVPPDRMWGVGLRGCLLSSSLCRKDAPPPQAAGFGPRGSITQVSVVRQSAAGDGSPQDNDRQSAVSKSITASAAAGNVAEASCMASSSPMSVRMLPRSCRRNCKPPRAPTRRRLGKGRGRSDAAVRASFFRGAPPRQGHGLAREVAQGRCPIVLLRRRKETIGEWVLIRSASWKRPGCGLEDCGADGAMVAPLLLQRSQRRARLVIRRRARGGRPARSGSAFPRFLYRSRALRTDVWECGAPAVMVELICPIRCRQVLSMIRLAG